MSSSSPVLDRPANLLELQPTVGYGLVAIAPNVPDAHILAEGTLPNTTVLRLTPGTDAIDQITSALQQHPETTSLHIISHGAPGTLYLGETELSLTNIESYSYQLRQWSSLEQILLYGCHVAIGDAGEEFVTKLHKLAGADIAASRTLTGHTSQGGNWQLETRTDDFTIQTALISKTLHNYSYTLGEFRIVSLGGSIIDEVPANSAVADHDDITGDDRGGIAISGTKIFVTGDAQTGSVNRSDLSGGVALNTRYDGIFNDIATDTVYTLGTDSTTPLESNSGTATVTHLLEIDGSTGALTGDSVALSGATVAVDTSGDENGVFSGYGRVVVYDQDGGNFYDIDIASGAATNAGNTATPDLRGSENWADWGVAEYFDSQLYVTYRNDAAANEIERLRVSDGTTETLGTFRDLSDLSSFTVSPNTGRWYFHYEGSGQFDPDRLTSETVGFADATFDTVSSTNFRITSLGGNVTLSSSNSQVIDHDASTGDDRGGIAVSDSRVFVTGDAATGNADLELSKVSVSRYDGIFSDIANGKVYTLATDSTTPLVEDSGIVTITHLLELDGSTGEQTGISMALSGDPITLDTDSSENGVFAGYWRTVIYDQDSGNFYNIDLISGTVSNLGNAATPDLYGSENWADWGVAEYFGGELYATYRSDSGDEIERLQISDGATTTLATFSDLSDLSSFTVSPTTNRWYFHHEDDSQFGGDSETLGYADASIVAGASMGVGELQIVSLSDTNSAVVDHDDVTGDDRGGIAISNSHVFVTGDDATGYAPLDLSSVSGPSLYDGIFNDIATGTIYTLGTDTSTPLRAYTDDATATVTHLLEIDGNTGDLTGNSIALSMAIDLDTDNTNGASGVFAGHERVVIYDNVSEIFYDIELPSGTVTVVETEASPALFYGENWADWGVAEYFGDTLYVTYRNDSINAEIERLNLTDGTTEVIASFADISDLSSFSVSPETGRWYFHYEGGGQFDPNYLTEETVGFADAVFDIPTAGLVPQANNLLTVNSDKSALKVTQISGAPGEIYEIAVVKTETDGSINGIDSDDANYLNEVLNNAQILLSTLPDSDISDLNPSRLLEVTEDSNLQFMLIRNGTLDSLLNTGVGDVSFALPDADGQSPISIAGSADAQSVEITFQPTGTDIPVILQMALTDETPAIGTGLQGTVEGEMIDLRAETGELTVNIEVYREAALDNLVGFYQVENEQGQVFDEFGNLLNPGDMGYIKAAMQQSVTELSLSGENGSVINSTATMMAGKLLSTFIVVDGTTEQLLDNDIANDPIVYFNHLGANTDGQDHVRLMGDNTFGFEDMTGGGDMDFDDVIARVSFG
ncbi:MAG: DUF4347 domain-containing protein [Leptolyngbyaceae cyanobacterium]